MKIQDQGLLALTDEIFEYINNNGNLMELEKGNFSFGVLPDISLEKSLEVEIVVKAYRHRIDALRQRELDHYDEMMLECLDTFAAYNFNIGFMQCLPSKYYFLDFPVTPYSCLLHYVLPLGEMPLADADAAEAYTRTIEQYPRLARQIHEKIIAQTARNIFLPKDELELSLNMLRSLVFPLDQHPLRLTHERLEKCGCNRFSWMERVNQSIRDATDWIEKIAFYLDSGQYREKLRSDVGLAQYPGGLDYYHYLVRYHTTYEISPEELMRLGLENIEKNEHRMEQIRRSLGYSCSMNEFIEKMQGFPDLFESSPEGIGRRMKGYLDRIKPVMPLYFVKMCEADCEVVRLAPEKEPSMTFGYYAMPNRSQPKGLYYFNGHRPEEKNQVGTAALVYHELLPGHHFQQNLLDECEDSHPLFKNLMFTAYTEGWAEYAATLAGEMGMFSGLLDEYGRLQMDMALSARLVIDTGMNAFGWSREKAAKFLKANTGWAEDMIFTETNRYANDLPAQALGYKFGSLMFADLRKRAEQALADKFDIKEFHAHLLELGSVPLKVLEKHIEWYITQRKGHID